TAVGAARELDEQGGRPRRGGHDDAGVAADAGGEAELGPGVGAAPGAELVAPGATEVPAPPPVGLVRGADLDAGPVEVDLAEGPVPGVGEAAAAEHLEDPRRALDAHVAGVAVGGGDHGVVARVGDSGLDEVLGAGAGLAPAAAGEDE